MKAVKNIDCLDIGHIKQGQETDFQLKISEVSGDVSIETDIPHRHNFYMICLVVQGGGTHVIDFEKTDIIPNRLYFLKPDQIHFWDVVQPSKLAVVQFTPDFLTHLFGLEVFPALQTVYSSYFDLTAEKSATLLHLFTHMEHEFHSGERYSEKIIQAYLFVLLTEIERLNQSLEKQQTRNSKYEILHRFKQLLNERFRETTSISEFANLLNISPNYLNIVVKETTGKTANTLMHERVFLEAKRLLIQQHADITQIAYDLGFKDASYFSRFFRKASGQSPSEFRTDMYKMYRHLDNLS